MGRISSERMEGKRKSVDEVPMFGFVLCVFSIGLFKIGGGGRDKMGGGEWRSSYRRT